MTNNNLPTITDEQRRAALNAAVEKRRMNAAIKNAIRTKQHDIEWALNNPDAQGIRVYQLIMSVPGIGKAKVDKIMAQAGIQKNRRVRGLGRKQTENLIELLKGC